MDDKEKQEWYQWKGEVTTQLKHQKELITVGMNEVSLELTKLLDKVNSITIALETQKIVHSKDIEATKENITHNKEQFELKLTPMRATIYGGGAWGVGFLTAHWDKIVRFFWGNH